MCNFIGWNVANSDGATWGNYTNVASSPFTGYCSGNVNSLWTNSTTQVTKLGNGTNSWIFPTGKFINANGKNTLQKNIFDIAGNVWEWTTEIAQSSIYDIHVVMRGGAANSESNVYPATNRSCKDCRNLVSCTIGFRIILYVE